MFGPSEDKMGKYGEQETKNMVHSICNDDYMNEICQGM